MKQLAVDFDEIASAMESRGDINHYYLDTETGEVIGIPSELHDLDFDVDDEALELPEWEQELLPIVEEINAGSDRYVVIPQIDPSEAYNDMAEFAETVTNPELSRLLAAALVGRGIFGRFKDALARFPGERQRWFEFKAARMEERIRHWLNEMEIEPVARE